MTIGIAFNFMALFYNHTGGLTSLLPSSGHDATLTYRDHEVKLQSADVWLLRDGKPFSGKKAATIMGGPGLHVDDILKAVGRKPGAKPTQKVLKDPMESLPELNARVVLPPGELTHVKSQDGESSAPWMFFKNDDHSGHKMLTAKTTDRAEYAIPTEANVRYSLVVNGPHSRYHLDLSPNEQIEISNADRPTRDTAVRPWFEISYLLDLLNLGDGRYPVPFPDLGAPLTPNKPRCSPLMSGLR